MLRPSKGAKYQIHSEVTLRISMIYTLILGLTPLIGVNDSSNEKIHAQALALKNPFITHLHFGETISKTDLENQQRYLRCIKVDYILAPRYQEYYKNLPFGFKAISYDDFANRLHRGLWQTMIDSKNDLIPEKQVIEINGGGKDCVVLFSSLDRVYPSYIRSLIEALKEVGFKGSIYYRIGGYPNPNGDEIYLAGVPYAFKLFMLEEARNLGFRYLLWLDASLFPLRNPQPLFELIRSKGVVYKETAPLPQFMLPKTRDEIYRLLGVDVLACKHLRMPVFGIDTNLDWFNQFLREHKRMAILGTPFLSCLPEEFILTALKERYWSKDVTPTEKLLGFEFFPSVKNGYFFYLRHH